MKVHELINLYIGFNSDVDFKVLICANDLKEAAEIAARYVSDANLDFDLSVMSWDNLNTNFDCDYVLTSCQVEDQGKVINVKQLLSLEV